MLKNFNILINDLALKTSYEKMVQKHNLEIEDINRELSCNYKSPSYYEEYVKVDGSKDTWVPPRVSNPGGTNPKREKLLERIEHLEKEIKLLGYRLEELQQTMEYIKSKNEFLYNMLTDCYAGDRWNNKIHKKYFYSSFYTFKKAAQRMFYKIF